MQVYRGVPACSAQSAVLTIGNFDGVHLGHVELLRRLVGRAHSLALPAVVMTFEPHPREFFLPLASPLRLSSLREKLELLSSNGVDRVHVCRFDARFAALSAEAFIDDLLVKGLSVRHLIVGDDFRFGRGRVGDFAMLQAAGGSQGFKVDATPSVMVAGERVSSSAVRDALQAGDLDRTSRLLGRDYSVSGKVVHGDKRGRIMGFPTANIGLKGRRLPLNGVFAVSLEGALAKPLPAVANVGVRPSVGGDLQPTLEVHALDFEGDLYGRHVRVNFLHRLRGEEKFADLEALKLAISRDVAAARAHFKLT
ncbi:MAG: Riboflavin biosynthesis protein RibF [Pseudomonadota bacterium]